GRDGSATRPTGVDDLGLGAAALALAGAAAITTARRTVQARVGDGRGDDANRANRIVVSWDHVIDEIRVAIRVRDGHDGDAQLAGFLHGDELLRGIDDEHDLRNGGHALEAANVL